MRHLSEGEIQAYLDQELSPGEQERAAAHLGSCAPCRRQAETLQARSAHTRAHLQALEAPFPPRTAAAARSLFEARRVQKEQESETMFSKLFSRRYRPAWAALVVVLILAVSMAFSPVRAIANSFLGLFRVQQIQVIQVNPGSLPQQLGQSSQFEAMLSKDVTVKENGKTEQAANAAEAGAKAGFPVRLPTALKDQPGLYVSPQTQMTFLVDLKLARAVLQEVGRGDIQLPDSLDGAKVEAQISRGVMAQYGECKFDLQKAQADGFNPDNQEMPRLPHCTSLLQIPSPDVTAPEGLDVTRLGEAYLEVMGVDPKEAARIAQNVDWTSTFILPLPSYAGRYEEVTVDGVPGTVILQDAMEGRSAQYMLLWVKDGMLYSLVGPGDTATAVEIANSLQ